MRSRLLFSCLPRVQLGNITIAAQVTDSSQTRKAYHLPATGPTTKRITRRPIGIIIHYYTYTRPNNPKYKEAFNVKRPEEISPRTSTLASAFAGVSWIYGLPLSPGGPVRNTQAGHLLAASLTISRIMKKPTSGRVPGLQIRSSAPNH